MLHDTVKLPQKGGTRLIAHRGVSGIETENTCAAFVAAGNRSYFGIESDVHRTADGEYLMFHDDTTERLAGTDLRVEETDAAALCALPLRATQMYKPVGGTRSDLRIPSLAAYIRICRLYQKTAVLELKNHMTKTDIGNILDIIAQEKWLEQVIFISFDFENLVFVREIAPKQPVQFLTDHFDDALVDRLSGHRFDLDIAFAALNEKRVRQCHDNGIKVNCWTVDEPADAKRLISYGVDFITTNILE